MNDIKAEIGLAITHAAEVNRDVMRKIIPQPRGQEVDIFSPWEEPNLKIAIRRFLGNVGAVDNAIRTSRGDVAREQLQRISGQKAENGLSDSNALQSDRLLASYREHVDDLGCGDFQELLRAQGGDLTLESNRCILAASIGQAFFEANPVDRTIDFTKIPDEKKPYSENPAIKSKLISADRKHIQAVKSQGTDSWQEGYFRLNLANVMHKITHNETVHPLARATLKNFLKHEANFWHALQVERTNNLLEMQKPTMTRETWTTYRKENLSRSWQHEEPSFTPEGEYATQYYFLEDSIGESSQNEDVYVKFQEETEVAFQKYDLQQPQHET